MESPLPGGKPKPGPLGLDSLRDALGTYPDEFKFMPDDLEIRVAFYSMFNRDIKINRGINNSITTNTSEMVMVFRFTVKPFQRATRFEFLNIAAFSKDFKVAIYGSKADARQALASHQPWNRISQP